METKGYAIDSPTGKFHPFDFKRREVADDDVLIKILYCGICHSDIHTARGEWGPANYPLVPGHEFVGVVEKVGSKVTKLKVGDNAGVGCLVDACFSCKDCKNDHEQHCPKKIYTYGSKEKDGNGFTFGGYSTQVVVKEGCTVKVGKGFTNLEGVAPLLCAGITSFSPLHQWKHKVVGKKVGVVGLGGLGHLGVKFAVAMGAEVYVFSTSESKKDDALKLGAKHFVNSKNEEQMKELAGSLDFILNTISAEHQMASYLACLDTYGAMVYVGAPGEPLKVNVFSLLMGNKIVAGSNIGGIKETQEMLDFCEEKGIVADIELIKAAYIDEAYNRVVKSDVKYRFVIDIDSMRS